MTTRSGFKVSNAVGEEKNLRCGGKAVGGETVGGRKGEQKLRIPRGQSGASGREENPNHAMETEANLQ